MKAYKGFDKDLKCKGFQYEVGKTYETDEAKLCVTGFHACEAPLETFDYYNPINSRYCEVDLDKVSEQRDGDSTKVVAKKITVGAEIGIPGIVKAHIEYVREKTADCNDLAENANGDAAQIGSSGDAAKIGSSGDAAKIGSSGDAAQIGSSGDAAKIGSSGRYAKIGSSGDDVWIDCSADHAVVVCAGKRARVKAPLGAWICLAEYDEFDGSGFPCKTMKCGQVDGKKLQPDVWYRLVDGKFAEFKENDDAEN